MHIIISIGAVMFGGAIGYAFGAIQNAALLRNKKHAESGKLSNGWTVMPGSMGRVAILLMVLAVVQVFCPMFFEESATPWLVSAGIVLGYGWTLLHKLRHYSMYQA